jgi:elongation factor G
VRICLPAHTQQMIYSDETRGQPLLVEIAIEPKSKADTEKLVAALLKLAAEDPAFGTSIDHESGQIILKGASELHLDTKLDALRRTHNIGVRVGAPQVAYRERITRRAEAEYTHKKPYGPKGEFAARRIHDAVLSLCSGPFARGRSAIPALDRDACLNGLPTVGFRRSDAA